MISIMYLTNVETAYGYDRYSIDEDTLQLYYPEEYGNGIKDEDEFFFYRVDILWNKMMLLYQLIMLR